MGFQMPPKRLSREATAELLSELAGMGYCLSDRGHRLILDNPHSTVDRLTDAVLRVEGFPDPKAAKHQRRAVKSVVAKHFAQNGLDTD
jgi:hypothetical protein